MESPHNFSGRKTDGASSYSFPLKSIQDAKYALANAHFAPNPECVERQVYSVFPELNPKVAKEIAMAKKKAQAQKTKVSKKVETVMSEFKNKKLKSSSGNKVVKKDQAIAIALSEAGVSKKKTKKKKKKK